MTVSHLPRPLGLAFAALALAGVSACADVGSGSADKKEEFPVVKSTDQDVIICQSLRTAIQRDKKAAAEARAAGRKGEAALKDEAVQAGVEGSKTVKGCDVSDLVPAAAASPTPS